MWVHLQILDLTGSFPTRDMRASVSAKLNPSYSTASIFASHWGWQTTSSYFPNHEDFFYEPGYNTKMWQATQYMPRLTAGEDGDVIPKSYVLWGKGHWGPNVYAGVRKDRCDSTLKPIRDVRATETAVEIGA